jgi:hypothetical protein
MPLLKDLWGIFSGFWDTTLKPMVEEFGTWIRANWPTIRDFLTNQLSAWLADIGAKIGKAMDYLEVAMADGGKNTALAVQTIWESKSFSLFEQLALTWGLKSATLWDKIAITGANLGKALADALPGIVSAILLGIVSFFAGLVTGMFNLIGTFLRNIWNWIWGIPPSDAATAGATQVPAYATGGIPMGPMLAMIGDSSVAEPIIPLTPQNLGAIGKGIVAAGGYQGGGAVSGPVHIHVQVGSREIGEQVIRDLKRSNSLQFGAALNPIGG